MYIVAKSLYDIGEYDTSLKLFQELAINEQSSEAYYYIAKIHSSKGDINNAIESYQKSWQLNPNKAEVYLELGQLYSRMG